MIEGYIFSTCCFDTRDLKVLDTDANVKQLGKMFVNDKTVLNINLISKFDDAMKQRI